MAGLLQDLFGIQPSDPNDLVARALNLNAVKPVGGDWFAPGELDPAAFGGAVQTQPAPMASAPIMRAGLPPPSEPPAAPADPYGPATVPIGSTEAPPEMVPQPAPQPMAQPTPVAAPVQAGPSMGERFGRFLAAGSPGSLARGIGEATYGADRAAETQNLTVQLLTQKGMDPVQARAVARSPEMLKAILPTMFGPKPGVRSVAPGEALVDERNNVVFRNEQPKPVTPQPGWEVSPDGRTMTPIKGGPADPDYVRSLNESKTKPPQLAYNALTDLSKKGGSIADARRFNESFKDEYGGGVKGTGVGGEMAVAAAQRGYGNAEFGQWWNDYNGYKNVVRNELFGSALTATEKAAFEAANITPDMEPKQIRENLKRQRQAVESAAKKLAKSLIANRSGSQDAIEAAYGVRLDDLADMVDVPKAGGSGADPLGIR